MESFRPYVLNHREYWSMGRRLGSFGETAAELEAIRRHCRLGVEEGGQGC